MLSKEIVHHRDAALDEWAQGRYYEAHEILEELAECFEPSDPSFAWALAMTRIAAAVHKLKASVGPKAVPGKLRQALADLAGAPADWCGIDMDAFLAEVGTLLTRLGPPYPVPRRVAAKPEGG